MIVHQVDHLPRVINGCLVLRLEQKLLSSDDAHYHHDTSTVFKPCAKFLLFYCLNLLFQQCRLLLRVHNVYVMNG